MKLTMLGSGVRAPFVLRGLSASRADLGLDEVGGAILVISQFTLYGDARKGNRPSFTKAAPPAQAEPLYEEFCGTLAAQGVHGRTVELDQIVHALPRAGAPGRDPAPQHRADARGGPHQRPALHRAGVRARAEPP